MKKLLAFIIIAIVLMSIPLVAAANSRPPVSKAVFIHRVNDFTKPDGVGKPPKPNPEPEEPLDYELMGKNIKWKSLDLTYVINPTISASNNYGLTESDIVTYISGATETWDDDSFTTVNHFATYSTSYAAEVDYNTAQPDTLNEIVFGDIPQTGAIAVCIVWYINVGPPSQRGIVEFDIIFDDVDFTWGWAGETNEENLGNTNVMDLQNIATHELGHALGLADLYDAAFSEQTMFGMSTEGETKKRTLNTGDVAGIIALYG